jgi:hypothetical protein
MCWTTTSLPQKPAQLPSAAVFVFATKSADGESQTRVRTFSMSWAFYFDEMLVELANRRLADRIEG